MALISISGSVSLEPFSAQRAMVVANITSGCTLTAGQAVYIDSAGELQPTSQLINSGSVTRFLGLVAKGAANGDYGLTVWGKGARFNYSTAMTPGVFLYVAGSGTGAFEGMLIDSPKMFAVLSGGGSGSVADQPVAVAISATDIVVIR